MLTPESEPVQNGESVPAIRERVARALFLCDFDHRHRQWDTTPEWKKDEYRGRANATLDALNLSNGHQGHYCGFCHGSRGRDFAVMSQALLDVFNAYDIYVEDDEMEPLAEAMGFARRAWSSATQAGSIEAPDESM